MPPCSPVSRVELSVYEASVVLACCIEKLPLRFIALLRVTLAFVAQPSGRVSLFASSSKLGFASRLLAPASGVPVPLRVIVRGLSAALLSMRSEALRAPFADGVKVTASVQLASGASDPSAQVELLSSAKSLPFVPSITSPVIASGASPLLVSVTERGLVVELATRTPKAMLDELMVTAGWPLVALRGMNHGLSAALEGSHCRRVGRPALLWGEANPERAAVVDGYEMQTCVETIDREGGCMLSLDRYG